MVLFGRGSHMIRQMFEEREAKWLSPFAMLSANTKGRVIEEIKCNMRTEYQRDRDRIIYSKSFRRLKHKTQVFISPEGDHYRTRLTHTLEVAQIARAIARCLLLNEDLTEAIALAHDLGHTPFGHAGEREIAKVCPLGFRHNEQSRRVVEVLEKDGKGLNLTWEVRDGITAHTGNQKAATLEGQIVRFADRIAYINHDIEDALRGNVIKASEIPLACTSCLGDTPTERINTMITDIVTESTNHHEIRMSPSVQQATDQLRAFMFERVYVGSVAKLEESKAERMIREIYLELVTHPDKLPQDMQILVATDGIHRVVCDYVAGMTDRYAIRFFRHLFIPSSWNADENFF